MMDVLRRFKAVYAIYNFFHRKELLHNTPLLKKYGLKKKYWASLSSKDFSDIQPGTDPDKKPPVTDTELFRTSSPENQKSILGFEENGFLVLKNYISTEKADEVNKTIAALLAEKKLSFRYGNKIMFAIHRSPLLKNMGEDKKLIAFLESLMQGDATLFQSINFIMGSEQRTHSDSIHMTTFPSGGLLGVWIALEDVNENNGPLHYYPGSHRLPYYLNSDYNNEGSRFLLGPHSYAAYEDMIKNKIAEKGISKQLFTAHKGDLLVWHANLFHGGEPQTDKSLTRKSMVFHYFNRNGICYHEITQRPALIKTK
ncbi:MAG: phytanoyl-CoA dioxygenase family protein [Bacteroidota bacterium]